MNSDIKLDGRNLEIIADLVIARALDIHLDHPDRRSTNSGYRRALVHNSEDGLTINLWKLFRQFVNLFSCRSIK